MKNWTSFRPKFNEVNSLLVDQLRNNWLNIQEKDVGLKKRGRKWLGNKILVTEVDVQKHIKLILQVEYESKFEQ